MGDNERKNSLQELGELTIQLSHLEELVRQYILDLPAKIDSARYQTKDALKPLIISTLQSFHIEMIRIKDIRSIDISLNHMIRARELMEQIGLYSEMMICYDFIVKANDLMNKVSRLRAQMG